MAWGVGRWANLINRLGIGAVPRASPRWKRTSVVLGKAPLMQKPTIQSFWRWAQCYKGKIPQQEAATCTKFLKVVYRVRVQAVRVQAVCVQAVSVQGV